MRGSTSASVNMRGGAESAIVAGPARGPRALHRRPSLGPSSKSGARTRQLLLDVVRWQPPLHGLSAPPARPPATPSDGDFPTGARSQSPPRVSPATSNCEPRCTSHVISPATSDAEPVAPLRLPSDGDFLTGTHTCLYRSHLGSTRAPARALPRDLFTGRPPAAGRTRKPAAAAGRWAVSLASRPHHLYPPDASTPPADMRRATSRMLT